MKRLYNELLSKHTTFKIGGPVLLLSIPENEGELIQEIKRCKKEGLNYKILGCGSNVLICDKGINGVVIKNTEACSYINKEDNNIVEVGSSIYIQNFVRFCIEHDLEGMEYLYSIPATIGGAIYMNAGTGKKTNLSISDNLVSVKIFDGVKIKEIKKEECKFNYRYSIFHKNKDWIILGATFKLREQPKEIGEKKIKERMDFVKKHQNRKHPNAGSIFKKISPVSKKLLSGIKIGNARMKGNWISNIGGASFRDVMTIIKIAKIISYLSLKKPELEIEIWK
jgi:UDP-N-acetylmuramate dehydrogenase